MVAEAGGLARVGDDGTLYTMGVCGPRLDRNARFRNALQMEPANGSGKGGVVMLPTNEVIE